MEIGAASMDVPPCLRCVSGCVPQASKGAGTTVMNWEWSSGSLHVPSVPSKILGSGFKTLHFPNTIRGPHSFNGLQPSGRNCGPEQRRRPKTYFSTGDGSLRLDGKIVFELLHDPCKIHGAMRVRVSSKSSDSSSSSTSPKRKNGLGKFLEIPRSLWNQLVNPLSNFGFGKRSIWEGGVGLFVMAGVVVLATTLVWVKGTQIRARTKTYEAVFEFAQAQGITVGTPVRIRGVDVGNVVGVRPSLERIDVVVELVDSGIVIPRNALVEVNQSGLISETLIDVTPRLPLPKPTVGPLDSGCSAEGLIVCDRERIKGEQGVSLDELVGICTKIAKQVDSLGVSKMYGMAERLGMVVEDAKPLLAKVQLIAGDIEPLLKEVQDGNLLKDLESLTRVATEAGHDLRKLNNSVLTSENMELLRESVSTLTKTLKHIESISKDVSGLTGDSTVRHNLKRLIESLSRLVTI